MESKYKRLVKNTGIYAIGSFGSKVLSFLIVPLYTYVLTPSQYGQVDLFNTTVSMLIPFMTLLIQEAAVRYIIGGEVSKEEGATCSLIVFLCGDVLALIFLPFYRLLFRFDQYTWIFFLTAIGGSFVQIFGQYLRAINENVAFAISGIIMTAVTVFSNLILLLVLKLGVQGYLSSILLSYVFSSVFIIWKGKLFQRIRFSSVKKSTLLMMLKFSIPLVPNSIMWWIMSAGDKYIINYFLGDSANGIYSLSLKIPTIITMLYSLFFQAWQISAIEENNSKDRAAFYENIFKVTTAYMAILTAVIIVGVKLLYVTVMSKSFAEAWIYVPLLSIATVFSNYGSFFGIVYTTSTKTTKAFSTTALGAIINVFANFVLVRFWGLQGIAAGTVIGYFAVMIIRARDTKKNIGMHFDLKRSMLSLEIILLQTLLTILTNDWIMYTSGAVSIVILAILYHGELTSIISLLKKKKTNNG